MEQLAERSIDERRTKDDPPSLQGGGPEQKRREIHAIFLDPADPDDAAKRLTQMVKDVMGADWFSPPMSERGRVDTSDTPSTEP